MNDTERLHQMSIELAEKQQVIDALLDEQTLLRARLHYMELRMERHMRVIPTDAPAFLRPQAE